MNGFQTFFTSDVGAHSPYTAAERQQQQRGRGQSGARASSNDFRGVGIGNGSSCINPWRLLLSVPPDATCWLRTGAVWTCAVPWILCYARVSYGRGMPCLSCGHYHDNAHFILDDRLCRSTLTIFSLIIATFVLFRYFVSSKNIKHVDSVR